MATASNRGDARGPLTRLLDIIFEDCGCDLKRGGQGYRSHDCELLWGLASVTFYTAVAALILLIVLSVGSGEV